jgi:hypothetical protein
VPRSEIDDRSDFLVFDKEVLAFCKLIATGRVLSRDDITGFGIDVLLFQAISGFPADRLKLTFSLSDDAG